MQPINRLLFLSTRNVLLQVIFYFGLLFSASSGAILQTPPDSGAPPSAFCHVTDGAFTTCPDGSAEWSDIAPMHFAESSAYLFADQADLDPLLDIGVAPVDTFMLMYDQCGRTIPLADDEYVLVTFDTVEGALGDERLERYVVHVFNDGTIVFFRNGVVQKTAEGESRVSEIEGLRGQVGFGPSPACAFDHVRAEFEIKLSATNIVVNGAYSPDPLWWSSDVPEEPEIPCPEAGVMTPVTLQPVTAPVQLALKPYQISYGELPIEFTSDGGAGGSDCTVTSNLGALPVFLDLFQDAPPGPVQIGESKAEAAIDFFEAANANTGGVPQCNFDTVANSCFLNSPGDGSSNIAKWSTDGFSESVFGVDNVAETGPLEFFVNLDAFDSNDFGEMLQNVEQFIHETLIDNLSGIDSLGLIQDPPADLLITDALGRRTGLSPTGILSEIPRSGYLVFPEVTAVVLVEPDVGSYGVEVVTGPDKPFSLSMSFADFLGNVEVPAAREQNVDGTINTVGANFTFDVTARDGTPGSAAVRAGFSSNVLAANDDGSTGSVPLGFSIDFLGSTFQALFVNNNGNVTFDAPLASFTPFDLTSTARIIVAPYFADVDTRVGNVVTYGAGTIGNRPAFGVNWPDVGCFSLNTSVLNNFQLILIDRSDVAPGDFDMEFNFDSIQWESGQASGGNVSCLGGAAARVGYSNGTGLSGTFFELQGSGVSGAFLNNNTITGLINNSLNSPLLGRYLLSVRNGQPVATSDKDVDGIADELDNCPRTANADQTDTDLNGVGDVCQTPDQLHDTAGLIQAFLDGTSGGWPGSLRFADEATLLHRLAHIVEFRLRVGLSDDALALTQRLVASLVSSGLVAAGDADVLVEAVLATLVTNVRIDIKPDSDQNTINLGSNGNVPVILFGAADFDVNGVDPMSVTLAGAAVRLRGNGQANVTIKDADQDGTQDMLLHIDTTALELSDTATDAILEGVTFNGQRFQGSDVVRIVP